MESKEKGGESVRAVHRALELLTAFSREDHELTAGQLLQRVDLSRPTLYRLLYTLQEKGFITVSGDPQRFRLGPAVARLSHVWTATLDLASIAEPVLKSLWSETGETVAVFVASDAMRVCLAELPSPQPLSFKRGVGYSERIALGASGRAILAFSPMAHKDMAILLKGLKMNRAAFEAELAATRERGYSVSRNELIAGAVAVAAPFFQGGEVAGSIGVFGPAARLHDTKLAELGRLVIESGTQLSAALGSSLPTPAVPPKIKAA